MIKHELQLGTESGGPLRWRGRLWLEGPEGTFLGYGRVVLLERIREHCSIAQAAKSMGMSYKHAWDLLDSMTRQAGCPLVVTVRGGKGGGGAALTPAAERMVTVFWQYYKQFHLVLDEMTAEMAGALCGAQAEDVQSQNGA